MIYKMAQNEDFQIQTKSGGIVKIPPIDGDTELVTKAQAEAGWWSEWVLSEAAVAGEYTGVEYLDYTGYGPEWCLTLSDNPPYPTGNHDENASIIRFNETTIAATRHRVAAPVPTTPSDLGISAESWTFTLEDGTTLTKSVAVY